MKLGLCQTYLKVFEKLKSKNIPILHSELSIMKCLAGIWRIWEEPTSQTQRVPLESTPWGAELEPLPTVRLSRRRACSRWGWCRYEIPLENIYLSTDRLHIPGPGLHLEQTQLHASGIPWLWVRTKRISSCLRFFRKTVLSRWINRQPPLVIAFKKKKKKQNQNLLRTVLTTDEKR